MMQVEFKSNIYQLERLLNVHYIEVLPEHIEALGGGLKRRVHCTINQSLTYQSGLMALGEGKAYITLSKARLKKLGRKVGDEVSVALKPDDSKYGVEMPPELAEWLDQDEVVAKKFEALTPGKQRYIIQYVLTVKSPRLRLERTSLLLENLKRYPANKVSFRQLLGKD